ncbi:conserved exported protein of unknown function [Sterolibacterium denitrificans]|uniref:Lipoprotein n=1 Tax=Sterolibacterium denitrificans TaxID=157592 RepID=A0A7Z7HSE2_9PROT|nr:hypothetical protein [Sterolibacterium denitrificans]SMB27660.1 conserved exported protein of unknown function [Sterolibacterium denitrificans]
MKANNAISVTKPLTLTLAAAPALLLAACVTINIYFPAAAAEKMADKIIDEVWQAQKEGASKPQAAPVAPAKADNPNVSGEEK